MSLRKSYAAVLQLLRTQKGLSQESLSGSITQTTVSKLELAKSTATVDTSHHLAAALKIELPTLLALVVASHENRSPRDVLRACLEEIEALGMADTVPPSVSQPVPPPGVAEAKKKWEAVHRLRSQGLTQAQAAAELGFPESTLRRLWHQGEPG